MRERVFPPDFPLKTRFSNETAFVLERFLQICVQRWGGADRIQSADFSEEWEKKHFKYKLWFSCIKDKNDHDTWVMLNFRRPYTQRSKDGFGVKNNYQKPYVERFHLTEANPGYWHPTTKAKFASVGWQDILKELSDQPSFSWHLGDAPPREWLFDDPRKHLSWLAADWRYHDYKDVQPILAEFEREQLQKRVGHKPNKRFVNLSNAL